MNTLRRIARFLGVLAAAACMMLAMTLSATAYAAGAVAAAAAPVPAPAAMPAPALQAFESDSLARIVAQHKGKPFVLVVWSLDCEYCITSLKTLGEEQRQRKQLHVVTLSTDAAADPQLATLMRQRLAEFGVRGPAWAYGNSPEEQLRYAIDPKWYGEKPRSYWFNARGERIAHSGVITAALIDKLSDGR